MLAPDLVQPRKLASAVVISSSLSSVTFPDTSPGRLVRAAARAAGLGSKAIRSGLTQPPGMKPVSQRARQPGATAATGGGGGSVGWARPRWRGDVAGQAGGLEARPMSTSEPGPADPAAGA